MLAIASGFQHSLAMLAGLITPPIIFASSLNLDSEMSAYMISASLIASGALYPSPLPAPSLMVFCRHPKFGADVPHTPMAQLLPRHWPHHRCRHELRHT